MAVKALCASALAALIWTAAAFADAPTVRITQADQTKASEALLHLKDLGVGWTGGATKPDPLTALKCPGFDPKESDLVVTGHAAAHFAWPKGGVTLDQDTQVLKSTADVATDFKRSIGPKLMNCLAYELKRGGKGRVTNVKVAPLTLAHVGSVSAAYRAEISLNINGHTGKVIRDFVFFGIGRLEYSLVLDALPFQAPQLAPFEQDVSTLLARRAPSGTNVA